MVARRVAELLRISSTSLWILFDWKFIWELLFYEPLPSQLPVIGFFTSRAEKRETKIRSYINSCIFSDGMKKEINKYQRYCLRKLSVFPQRRETFSFLNLPQIKLSTWTLSRRNFYTLKRRFRVESNLKALKNPLIQCAVLFIVDIISPFREQSNHRQHRFSGSPQFRRNQKL